MKELMTKTTTPKAPRMTKAAQLAKIELETLAIEAQIAAEKALETPVPPVTDPLDAWFVPIPSPKPMYKVVKTVKTGVGAQILVLIAQGELSNKEIVAKVLEDNPLRKTTYACVAWYKSQVAAGKIDLPQVAAGKIDLPQVEEESEELADEELADEE